MTLHQRIANLLRDDFFTPLGQGKIKLELISFAPLLAALQVEVNVCTRTENGVPVGFLDNITRGAF